MYDQSVSSYLQNLNSFVQQQAQQIQELERQLKEFQNEISTLKQQPSTRIDRLEYKFDQLKIERLEGTLNIGLNPTDPNAVQNFEVGQTSPQVGMMQQEQAGQQMQQIRQNVDMYLNEEIPALLEKLETQYESRLDEANKYHIIEDIRKQMDSRIKYYLSHVPKEENTAPAQYAEQIAEHVKRDIVRAVEHFIKHIPGEMKGDEVIQVYTHCRDASMKVPINQLKRFQRITLSPGEEKTVTFNIPASEFSFYSTKTNEFETERGEFEIQIGSSSKDIRLRKAFLIE